MNKFLFNNLSSSISDFFIKKSVKNIRKAKPKEEAYFYSQNSRQLNKVISGKDWEIFINNENFLHNDVGPASKHKDIKFNHWYWNGHLIA